MSGRDAHHPRLRPRPRRRDRAAARARLAGARARRRHDRLGQPDVEKTTANALRVLEFVGRDVPVARGADRPLVRERFVADYVHGETGLDGPELPPARRAPVAEHAVEFLAGTSRGTTLVATGPLTNVALLLALAPGRAAGPDRADGRRDRRGERDAGGRVQHLGRSRGGAARLRERPRVTMVGLDVTHRALVTPAHAERLRAAGRAGTDDGRAASTSTGASTGESTRARRLADARPGRARARDRPGLPDGSPTPRRGRLRWEPAAAGRTSTARPRRPRAERAGRRRHRRRAVPRRCCSTARAARLLPRIGICRQQQRQRPEGEQLLERHHPRGPVLVGDRGPGRRTRSRLVGVVRVVRGRVEQRPRASRPCRRGRPHAYRIRPGPRQRVAARGVDELRPDERPRETNVRCSRSCT